ncbi:MAG: GatB/YqeY domain-containing protein [Hyphomicrobiaceae bacterium]|nr:GatB/YqeY domain-containing protein [Hyphomicrobiaceae bacterium]
MLRDKIMADMKDAMRAGEKAKVSTLRLMNSAIKSADIDARPKGIDLIGDPEILQVFAKMIKQRRDSVEQFTSGGRADLAASEQAEIEVIESYMPKQMSEDEVKAAATAIIADLGAAGMKDMGKVIAAMKDKFAGQMDFGKASGVVKELLK